VMSTRTGMPARRKSSSLGVSSRKFMTLWCPWPYPPSGL
jgi:hypothetical protein